MGFSTLYWFYLEEATDKAEKTMMLTCAVGYQEAKEAFSKAYPESEGIEVTVLTPGEAILTVANMQKQLDRPSNADTVLTIVLTAERALKEENLKEITLVTGVITPKLGGSYE